MLRSQEVYERRIKKYEARGRKQGNIIKRIVQMRLLTALTTIILGILLESHRESYLLWISFTLTLIGFFILVYQHHKIKRALQRTTFLKEINERHLGRLDGQWRQFTEVGEEFLEEDHPYSKDLDIFGQGSLFQWINSCHTVAGKRRLAQLFTEKTPPRKMVLERQKTIMELSSRRWWRQRLQLEGKLIQDEPKGDDLVQWATEKNHFYGRRGIQLLIKALPITTILSWILTLGGVISMKAPVALLFVHFILLNINIANKNRNLALAYHFKNRIKVYGKILQHFENSSFGSGHLQELKKRLRNEKSITALGQLAQLERLTDRIANRSNMAFFPINLITLWDYQCVVALEKWKQRSGAYIQDWLEVIGEVEALSSLATIPYDYPQWAIPEIMKEASIFSAKDLGHPLLTNNQVSNDVSIDGHTQVLLITGSNMSGKSTLLRTVGINLVLAYSGAPICGKALQCSGMRIYSCMRVSDNLEKNISSFYAELIRIRQIVEAAKEQGQVLFLLDEIFKGTNSQDRHMGAKLLIKQLCQCNGLGLVSTHDLELAVLEQESSGTVKNYHFQESYQNNEIHFDYRLRPGVSTTRNALYLMKIAGVDVDDQII